MTDAGFDGLTSDWSDGRQLVQRVRPLDPSHLLTALEGLNGAARRVEVARALLQRLQAKADREISEARVEYYESLVDLQALTGQRSLTAELAGVPVSTIRHARDYLRGWRNRNGVAIGATPTAMTVTDSRDGAVL